MYNFKILNDGDCYDLYGGQSFDSLLDLLRYYMFVSLRPDALELAVPATCSTDTAGTTGAAASTSSTNAHASEYANMSAMKAKGGGPSPFESETGEGPPGRLRLKSGAFVDLLYPFIDVAPTAERWFHGPLTYDEARQKLAGTLLSSASTSCSIPPLW